MFAAFVVAVGIVVAQLLFPKATCLDCLECWFDIESLAHQAPSQQPSRPTTMIPTMTTIVIVEVVVNWLVTRRIILGQLLLLLDQGRTGLLKQLPQKRVFPIQVRASGGSTMLGARNNCFPAHNWPALREGKTDD